MEDDLMKEREDEEMVELEVMELEENLIIEEDWKEEISEDKSMLRSRNATKWVLCALSQKSKTVDSS